MNGDADVLLEAHEFAAAGDVGRDRRTAAIHSQFAGRDQLEAYASHRIIPSFFTSHAFYIADAHICLRGKEQAYFLSRMRAALDAGLRPDRAAAR